MHNQKMTEKSHPEKSKKGTIGMTERKMHDLEIDKNAHPGK